jgi:hypothetical protein
MKLAPIWEEPVSCVTSLKLVSLEERSQTGRGVLRQTNRFPAAHKVVLSEFTTNGGEIGAIADNLLFCKDQTLVKSELQFVYFI